MSEHQFRNKVVWFSFLFSLLVIWMHSYNAELFLGVTDEMAQVYRTEHGIGDLLGQIAVPGFFMISGYLFYRTFRSEQPWQKTLEGKWRRRIHSLLVPYVLWNFIYYLGYVIGSRMPGITDIVGKGTIPFTVEAAVDAVLHYRYNYVFWYLYQLILLTILAPFFCLVLRRAWSRWTFLAAAWGLVLFDANLPLLNEDALVYYATAAAMAMRRPQIPEQAWSRRGAWIGAAMIVGAAASYRWGLRFAFVPGFVVCRILAVGGLWLAIPGERLPDAREFMKNSFFLYAVHFALVRLINKIGALVIPAVKWEPFVLYLLMPFLVLGIGTAAAGVLKRWLGPCWTLLSGGRNGADAQV